MQKIKPPKMKTATCPICGGKISAKWVVIQHRETVKMSKVPFGYLYLSPDETDPKLVEIITIPTLKEIIGNGKCKKCQADCSLVGSPDGTPIVVKAELSFPL